MESGREPGVSRRVVVEARGETGPAGEADSRVEEQQPLDPNRPLAEEAEQKVAALERALRREKAVAERLRRQADILASGLAMTSQLLKEERQQWKHVSATNAWKLVTGLRAWSLRCFPYGSLRREIYRRTLGALARRAAGTKAPAAGNRPVPGFSPPFSSTLREPAAAPGTGGLVCCEDPRPGDSCGGVVLIRGWALAKSGVERVEIFLGGEKLDDAVYGQPRPDVESDFAAYPDAANCGFFYVWNSEAASEGPHVLALSVQSKSGSRSITSLPITIEASPACREFDRWIAANEPSAAELGEMGRAAEGLAYRPLISVVIAVSGAGSGNLRQAIDSVRAQVYPDWQLCLADGGPHEPEIRTLLQDASRQDPRIRFVELPEAAGVSAATNAALSLATGEFAGILGQNDELAPDALYWLVKSLQDRRDTDVIYSDEDKLDLIGKRFDPFFKPDWSPDLLLSFNYISHFLVVRRQTLHEVGGLRSEYEGSQEYDLLLRLMSRSPKILHLPRVLYHWRATQGSAFSPEAEPRAESAARRALEDCFLHHRVAARVDRGCMAGKWLVRYEVLENPKVGVIMPSGGRMDLLQPCLESFFATTDYANYEILLVDNSKGSDVERLATKLGRETGKLRRIDYQGRKFNYSALNNFAAVKTDAPLLLLLNDDTTMVNRDWLTAMVEHGQRREVGAVGAKLLYPSGRIQHAGAVMGIYEGTSHAFKHLPGNSRRYFSLAQVVRNCSHVTAACLMTRRSLYLELGGLDEKHFKVAFQDVDYCLRLHKAGYFIVYTPAAVLVHHESVTKAEKIPNLWEVLRLKKKWADLIAHDPFYSPNLTRRSEDYGLRFD